MKHWIYNYGSGRVNLKLQLYDTGNGLQGLLTGGETPHIGGVVLAVPRKSLTGEGWSADLYITPVPNHKDVDFAYPLANSLARLSHSPVVITAGIHSDSITSEELDQLRSSLDAMMKQVFQELEQYFNSKINQ
ncbi:hypothetical protein [Desulfitobacterium sp. Sab5]|uniref:prenylated flavin chaperone LpdD n=1 Tax=Desulfitobacterium TaxID=36853 RepID=UPI003CF63ECA